MNKATMKAENPPNARQSPGDFGCEKLKAKMRKIAILMITSPQRPYAGVASVMVIVGRRSLGLGSIVIAAMTTVPSVSEDVKQRTSEQEQERQVSVQVSPVLREQKEPDDGEKAEEGYIAAAHG